MTQFLIHEKTLMHVHCAIKNNYDYCRVTIGSPNPKVLGYKPNEPNIINLWRVSERT